MSDPISFASATPRFGMPMLYAGQSQKEVLVNEGFVRIDALIHCSVEDELATPPADPADGQSWLVGSSPDGAWSGESGRIAARQLGQWIFLAPVDGMRIINRATGQDLRRIDGLWQGPSTPELPTGGPTVDSEARAAIGVLIEKLREAGIFSVA